MSLIKARGVFSLTQMVGDASKQVVPQTITLDISNAKVIYVGSVSKFAGHEYLYRLDGEHIGFKGERLRYNFYVREYPVGGFNYDDLTDGASVFSGKSEYTFDTEVPQYNQYP